MRWGGFMLLLTGAASCVPGSPANRQSPERLPGPVGRDPEIRIGLAVGASSATLGGHGALAIHQPDGSRLAVVPAAQTWRVLPGRTGLTLMSSTEWTLPGTEIVTIAAADPAAPVRMNGRSYRGLIEIFRDRRGITLVNRLGLEDYLQGVVSAEMGRRSSSEHSALQAQAVVSRTYALRNLGRRRPQGFDLLATVSDQVYGGIGAETPEGRAAVADTRGRVLTHAGAPIESFFYSTCGGRTADSYEVFRGGSRPYLRSIRDRAENGADYCSISPRYRWREEWSAEALRATLQRNLPDVAGIRGEQVDWVTDVRVTRRTASGRVGQLAIALGGPEVRVDGLAIRQVLRPPSGELLRSNAFHLAAVGAGRQVTHLAAEGMGAGHGVGFCQWGAVGRARAGQGYQQILAAYFPGTRVERRY
jgi:stage II sporulation protein D